MRVLVTGMGGELGTRVAQLLEERDEASEIAGFDMWPPRRRLRRSEFHRIEPLDQERITEFVHDFAPEIVIHYGVYEPDSRLGGREAAEASEACTVHVLTAAAETGRLERVAVRSGLEVYGRDYATPDGTCLRDYIHVCDLADAHIKALEALEQGKPSTAYNVGTGTPHSVKSVIDTVSRVIGRPVAWESAPRRPGDPAVLYAASDRARRELGWQPQYADLEVIVRHAWQWHSTHPRGYVE